LFCVWCWLLVGLSSAYCSLSCSANQSWHLGLSKWTEKSTKEEQQQRAAIAGIFIHAYMHFIFIFTFTLLASSSTSVFVCSERSFKSADGEMLWVSLVRTHAVCTRRLWVVFSWRPPFSASPRQIIHSANFRIWCLKFVGNHVEDKTGNRRQIGGGDRWWRWQ